MSLLLGGGGGAATGGFTMTVALAYFVPSAVLVARTDTVTGLVTDAGAVYRPVEETLPTAGLIDHLTPAFVVPDTVAMNWRVWAGNNVALAGLIATETGATIAVAIVAVFVMPLALAVTRSVLAVTIESNLTAN